MTAHPSKSSTPWGHKVTVHIYVAGTIEDAADISDEIVEWANETDAAGKPYLDLAFVGVTISDVQDEPKDQVAT